MREFEYNMRRISAVTLICIFMIIPVNIVWILLDTNGLIGDHGVNALGASMVYSNTLGVGINEISNTENAETLSVYEEQIELTKKPSDSYSEYEIHELAKIIMCEAEGQSQRCKEYIGQVVMNRVNSTKYFPDTIHTVIFDGIQFTPTFDGRWDRVEPNKDCYDAAYTVLNAPEPLLDEGTMWFEACSEEDLEDSWHYNNEKFEKVTEIDGVRFYKLIE